MRARERLRYHNLVRRTAMHEAGHAVAAVRFRFPLDLVELAISRDERYNVDQFGQCRLKEHFGRLPQFWPASKVDRFVIYCFAGPIAQKVLCGRFDNAGALKDKATALAFLKLYRAGRAESEFRRLGSEAFKLVSDPGFKSAVVAVGNQLIERFWKSRTMIGRISGRDVRTICRSAVGPAS